jgi:hypothetical protein
LTSSTGTGEEGDWIVNEADAEVVAMLEKIRRVGKRTATRGRFIDGQ